VLRALGQRAPLAGAWALLGLALADLFFRSSAGELDTKNLFNADSLYLPALYRDLFEEGGRWTSWKLTPAPYFFPDMGLYFLLDFLSGPFLHAMLAYAVVQVALLVWAAEYLVRSTLPPARADAPVQLLCALVVAALLLAYASGQFPPMQAAVLGGFHFSVVVFGMVAFGLALRSAASRGRRGHWLLAALCCAMTATDTLFTVAIKAPAKL
jgi:hypothetical protein